MPAHETEGSILGEKLSCDEPLLLPTWHAKTAQKNAGECEVSQRPESDAWSSSERTASSPSSRSMNAMTGCSAGSAWIAKRVCNDRLCWGNNPAAQTRREAFRTCARDPKHRQPEGRSARSESCGQQPPLSAAASGLRRLARPG